MPLTARCDLSTLAALLALATIGCPDAKETGPQKTCSRAYDKCVLPSGVLGVCDSVPCEGDATTQCLVCRSQH